MPWPTLARCSMKLPNMAYLSTDISEKPKLLIFEDEDSMQTILTAALLPEKYELTFVSTEMLGKTKLLNPDLILLDQVVAPMPEQEDFCRQIKSLYPSVPLVVISAYPLNKFGNHQQYIDLFIAKPFDLSYFLNGIDSCLVTD